MKKITLMLLSMGLFFAVQAQDFKPVAGNSNLELQFAPLGGTPLTIGGIRYRYFKTENMALRMNFFLGLNSSKEITQSANATTGALELATKNSSFTFNIRPGFEKHFKGTDRLSPYWGGEFDFQLTTSSEKVESQVATAKVTTTTKGKDGFIRIGLNLVTGFDYYIAKKLYLGAELGFGLSLISKAKIKESSDAVGYTAPPDAKQGSTFNFGPNAVGQIRLGFIF